ncbi:DUF421 domain-containing protein [Paenibacillus mendelii]|uniref:DUF421 domain-containing protein n=1 Tax=Paenibacillus mendelii TaxID=206163 RepID=A0ABV6JEB0_9BACL|nr:YetF domain-containing protein [Paenibacillus mendelii]MCQ6557120.1 DUF421 domain-containing protein [Paenibacillus mendelii]
MYTIILVKLAIGFIGLWIITFVIGRKEIGQITPFDFFTSILISEIVGNTLYDKNVTYAHLIYALALWALFAYLIEFLTVRFVKIKRLTEGRTVLLVERGEINQQLMRSCKLDFNQLMTMLREKDIFNLVEVNYLLYETNGTISVIKKPEFDQVRVKDLNLRAEPSSLSIPVIEKGVIQTEALRGKYVPEEKIRKLAREQGFQDMTRIAYAEYNEDKDELTIIDK